MNKKRNENDYHSYGTAVISEREVEGETKNRNLAFELGSPLRISNDIDLSEEYRSFCAFVADFVKECD